jgi:4'-phosphopantetheinyl transferase
MSESFPEDCHYYSACADDITPAADRERRLIPAPAGVDIWFARTDRLEDPDLLQRFDGLISPDERVRHDRFVFAADRRLFLQTRGMVRTMLSRYTGVPPESCTFDVAPGGRPSLSGAAAAAGIDFNVSHTRGLIALAVASNVRATDEHGLTRIGIDVEGIERPWLEGVPDRFFAPAEAAALEALPPAARQVRFYEYWTVKEAYLKARGLGLALPLDGFVIAFPDQWRPAITFTSIADRPERWQLFLAQPCEAFRLALAIEREGRDVPVVMRELAP